MSTINLGLRRAIVLEVGHLLKNPIITDHLPSISIATFFSLFCSVLEKKFPFPFPSILLYLHSLKQ